MAKSKSRKGAYESNRQAINASGAEGQIQNYDPTLVSLFAQSLGAVKLSARPSPSLESHPSTASAAEARKASSGTDWEEDGCLPQALMKQLKHVHSNFSDSEDTKAFIPNNNGATGSSRKRKRKDADDDLESNYMSHLMRDEVTEDKNRARTLNNKRLKMSTQELQNAEIGSLDQDGESTSDGDIVFDPKRPAVADAPQHEISFTSRADQDLEKSSRTVFLGNVSTMAIRSKNAKKTLMNHLASFTSSLPSRDGGHGIESLRFRSTAFAATGMPKKAAFVKKEIMDATTKSTNAYVVYTTELASREAVLKLNGSIVLDRHLRVDSVAHPAKIDHRRCVFIGNLGFVDDETNIRAARDEGTNKRPRKAKEPADVEEGLWRQFEKAGVVESVRVIRDKTSVCPSEDILTFKYCELSRKTFCASEITMFYYKSVLHLKAFLVGVRADSETSRTRVGKGFAYIQFKDANSVEKALLYHEKKFPPMLPRILRVARAKSAKNTKSANRKGRPFLQHAESTENRPKVQSQVQSFTGRARKMLGRAGAANLSATREQHRTSSRSGTKSITFEGFRASKAPKLQLDELFSPSMPLNGLSPYFPVDPSSPNRQPAPSAAKPPRYIEHDTPTKQQPASRIASPLPSEAEYSMLSPQTLSAVGTPTSEFGPNPCPDSHNWSAAIGRAATGKSGRVIEKLMGENDRLQREKKLAIVKLEEEVKRGESARSALEGLQVSNETLSSIHESEKTQMTKKDRKIELLRADLQSEKLRREKAENETRESRREREEVVEELRRVAAEDREETRRSSTQYEILAGSWKTLEDRYERQTQKLKADLNDLRIEIEGDKRRMTELEIVIEQLTHELAKVAQAKDKLLSGFQAYKKETESGLQGIQERAEKNNSANEKLHEQMSGVLGQMKHVVNVKRDSRENV